MRWSDLLAGAVLCALAPAPGFADEPISTVTVAAQRDPQWASYSYAYRTLRAVEGFDGPHDMVQIYYWLQPKAADVTRTGLRLRLLGPRTDIELPVDALGRALVPIDEAAARDGAEFLINRSAGSFKFANVIEIKPNDEGVYPVEYLQKACEQARQVYAYTKRWSPVGWRVRGMKCTGVKFQSTQEPANPPDVYFVDASGKEQLLPAASAPYQRAIKFADWPAEGRVRAPDPALSLTIAME
jgi:hypothetical protein